MQSITRLYGPRTLLKMKLVLVIKGGKKGDQAANSIMQSVSTDRQARRKMKRYTDTPETADERDEYSNTAF